MCVLTVSGIGPCEWGSTPGGAPGGFSGEGALPGPPEEPDEEAYEVLGRGREDGTMCGVGGCDGVGGGSPGCGRRGGIRGRSNRDELSPPREIPPSDPKEVLRADKGERQLEPLCRK